MRGRGSGERENRQVSKSEPKPQRRTIAGGATSLGTQWTHASALPFVVHAIVSSRQLELTRSAWILQQSGLTYAYKYVFIFRKCIVTSLFFVIIIRTLF